jgi:hypothetical protein
MSSSHTLLKYLRLIHLYTGVFIAPALLFFAFTGALQTFSLHETTRGSSYKPPAWAVMLAQIHKKQTPIVPIKKLPPSEKKVDKAIQEKAQASPTPPTEAPKPTGEAALKSHNPLPLKCFFPPRLHRPLRLHPLRPLHVLQIHPQQTTDHHHASERHHPSRAVDGLLT